MKNSSAIMAILTLCFAVEDTPIVLTDASSSNNETVLALVSRLQARRKPPQTSQVEPCQSKGKNCSFRPFHPTAWNTPGPCEMNIPTGYHQYMKPDYNIWCRLYPLGRCSGTPIDGLLNAEVVLGPGALTADLKKFKLGGYQCMAAKTSAMGERRVGLGRDRCYYGWGQLLMIQSSSDRETSCDSDLNYRWRAGQSRPVRIQVLHRLLSNDSLCF